MKNEIKEELKSALFIFIGSMIMGLSYSLFIIPFHIVPGGVSGVAIILNYLIKTPVGVTSIILNIPIFYMGLKILGRGVGIRTLIGMGASYLTIDFFYEILKIRNATNNELLAAIYGGVLLGLGLGFVFKGKATTGGTDIIGMIINKYTGISVGVGIFIVDFVIISLSGFIYNSLEAPLIGYLTLYISSQVIDFVIEGWSYAKMAFIVTNKENEVKEYIMNKMNRGGTFLHGETLYKGEKKKIIMTVISRKEFPTLRQGIKSIDPDAFVIITDVYEVLGKGFRKRLN